MTAIDALEREDSSHARRVRAMTAAPELGVKNVSLERYNERTGRWLSVLHGINLERRGTRAFSIVGPSGCGKTILNAIDGLIGAPPAKLLDGRRLEERLPDRAMVFQHDCYVLRDRGIGVGTSITTPLPIAISAMLRTIECRFERSAPNERG